MENQYSIKSFMLWVRLNSGEDQAPPHFHIGNHLELIEQMYHDWLPCCSLCDFWKNNKCSKKVKVTASTMLYFPWFKPEIFEREDYRVCEKWKYRRNS